MTEETEWPEVNMDWHNLELYQTSLRTPDCTLDDNLPAVAFLTKSGRTRGLPQFNLAVVDKLPLEILQELLSNLDLCTLTEFRRVNRRAMDVVHSIPQYKAIATHAPNVIYAASAIETAHSIESVYQALCTTGCAFCGNFGGYLYMITCKRVCFSCIVNNTKVLTIRHKSAIRKFGLNRQIVRALPGMKSIPGTYSQDKCQDTKRHNLVDYESAYQAGISIHGSPIAMARYADAQRAQRHQQYKENASQSQSAGDEFGTAFLRLIRFGYEQVESDDQRSGEPHRFMAIVRIPWLKETSPEVVRGLHCIKCAQARSEDGRLRPYKWTPSEASFQQHLRECAFILDNSLEGHGLNDLFDKFD